MNWIAVLLGLINGYKTYSSVILAIVSGLGMILTKNYGGGISEILQALTLVFSGASVVGLRHAVAKVSDSGQDGSGQAAKAK
jgi:hypothetical protein